jgi:hypothetical protein
MRPGEPRHHPTNETLIITDFNFSMEMHDFVVPAGHLAVELMLAREPARSDIRLFPAKYDKYFVSILDVLPE